MAFLYFIYLIQFVFIKISKIRFSLREVFNHITVINYARHFTLYKIYRLYKTVGQFYLFWTAVARLACWSMHGVLFARFEKIKNRFVKIIRSFVRTFQEVQAPRINSQVLSSLVGPVIQATCQSRFFVSISRSPCARVCIYSYTDDDESINDNIDIFKTLTIIL